MNIYSVYTDSSKKKTSPIFIPQGFSVIAGIFNLLWAIYHKMWLIALLVIIANTSSVSAAPHIVYSVNVAILFLFTFFAGELREYYARKKGFDLSDIVLAGSKEEAEVRYYMRINNQPNI